MFNKNQKNKAFTLIEVLIVTAVISLIASIVNAQMGEARQKADDAHMKTEVQQVRNAVEQYRQKTGTVPLAPQGSNYSAGSMVREDTTEYKEVMQQLVTEGFMPEVPTSPSGQSYSYLATEDGSQAVFAATLNNEDSGSGGSGSGNNSCDVIEPIITQTYGNGFSNCVEYGYFNWCSLPENESSLNCYNYNRPMCNELTYNSESQECFDQDRYNSLAIYHCSTDSSCNATSDDIGIVPSEACRVENPSCYGNGMAPTVLCDREVNQYTEYPVCSGGSNSDYCSCI